VNPLRLRLLIAAVILAAIGLVAVSALRTKHPIRAALESHIAGVDPKDASYPRMGGVMRSRAWIIAGPSQPDGTALFISLPDVQFGRERTVLPIDLCAALDRIRGLTWDSSTQSWTGAGRAVPFAQVRELLAAATPTPSDAAGILDLITGTQAPDLPDLAPLLLADPPLLTGIRIVPFHGVCGKMLLDRGRGPYVPVDRTYSGLMAKLEGRDIPQGWRVLTLRAVEP
jgi:hypothetical protein